MAATKVNTVYLIRRMPDADSPGRESKFTGPDPKAADKVCAAVCEGGEDSVRDLIGHIKEPTDPEFENYKAEYLLHLVAVYVGGPGRENERKMVAGALASVLEEGDLSKWHQGLLLRELQVAGGKDAVPVIGKHLLDDDLCEYATQALIVNGKAGLVELRRAVKQAKGRNRLTIVQALGVLEDPESVSTLKVAAGDRDPLVRAAAVWGLANTGDASAVDVVIQAADKEKGWNRIQASKACLLLAENLLQAGRKAPAVKIYEHLRDTRKGTDEAYLSEISEKALGAV
jgi:hypothetical protein